MLYVNIFTKILLGLLFFIYLVNHSGKPVWSTNLEYQINDPTKAMLV